MSGITIEELPSILKRIEDRARESDVLRDAVMEMGAAMAEVLEHLQESGPATAKAFADELRSIPLRAEFPASDVNINVSPTPVTVKAGDVNVSPTPVQVNLPQQQVNIPAPVVQVIERREVIQPTDGWDFSFEFNGPGGQMSRCLARRL